MPRDLGRRGLDDWLVVSALGSALHIPVLLDRVVGLLAPALDKPDSVLIDATLGLGGHSEAFLRSYPNTHLIGIDRDQHALDRAATRLAPFAERITLVHAVYDEIPDVLDEQGIAQVDGILFDLGVSSMQLDFTERGFAYAEDAPLDMRMDDSTGMTAADVLNEYSEADLARVLRNWGEERFARQIARAVVREREREPFTRSARLVDLIRDNIPMRARRTGGHPAKRTFQALRIEVNDELGVLRRAIPAALDAIGVGGRVVVMSYQSLEDRIVKQTFTKATTSTAPHDLPVVPLEHLPKFSLVTRGSEQATEGEIAENSRSASVRLRAIERRLAA